MLIQVRDYKYDGRWERGVVPLLSPWLENINYSGLATGEFCIYVPVRSNNKEEHPSGNWWACFATNPYLGNNDGICNKSEAKELLGEIANKYYQHSAVQVYDTGSNYTVFEMSDGRRLIRSYNTIVAVRDRNGTYHRTWEGWSATSQRHMSKSGFHKYKKEWEAMPVESLEDIPDFNVPYGA